MEIKFKKLHPDAKLPEKKTAYSAGYDLFAVEDVTLGVNKVSTVSTGLQIAAIEPGKYTDFAFEFQVRPRSGLAMKHGVYVINSPGTIDADYRGEVKVLLSTNKHTPYQIKKGERIAQLVVCPIISATSLGWTDEVQATDRGDGGFGSTGK